MASKDKNLSKHKVIKDANAPRYRIAVVVASYYKEITDALQKGCMDTLLKYGVKQKHIFIQAVPGAFELPLAAKWMYEKKKADAVICLGCVIKGETDHDVYINHAVYDAIMQLGLDTGAPFILGVITPNNLQQAKDRAGGKNGNKGVECAVTALTMLTVKNKLKNR